MSEPVVEVVYSLNEEDLLQHVRTKLKSRFKDPMFRTKLSMIFGCCFSIAGVGMLAMTLLGPRPLNRNFLMSAIWAVVFGGISGYRAFKGYRHFYETLRKSAEKTNWLVFRAYTNCFTITKPGISESSINWTSIKSVNLAPSYLYIHTKDDMMYRVPTRFMSKEQWEALKTLLTEIWDAPGEQSGAV